MLTVTELRPTYLWRAGRIIFPLGSQICPMGHFPSECEALVIELVARGGLEGKAPAKMALGIGICVMLSG